MMSYLPSSPSPFPGGNFPKDFLRYNDGAIFCFILCNQKKKGKVCMHAPKKDDSRLPLHFFGFLECESYIDYTATGAFYRM